MKPRVCLSVYVSEARPLSKGGCCFNAEAVDAINYVMGRLSAFSYLNSVILTDYVRIESRVSVCLSVCVSEARPLSTARCRFTVEAVNGFIYVVS